MELTGEWTVAATVPGGGEYTGTVSARRAGDAVAVEWDTTAGSYVGIGLPVADDWYVACGEDWDGLGLALIDDDGTVQWAEHPPDGTVGSDRLTPSAPRRWTTQGADFPFASVALAGDGDVLEARLTTRSGAVVTGLALTTTDGFAVAWYPTLDQTVILRYSAGDAPGTVDAVWALGGHADLATETLRPIPLRPPSGPERPPSSRCRRRADTAGPCNSRH
jgi:hypothetical protein